MPIPAYRAKQSTDTNGPGTIVLNAAGTNAQNFSAAFGASSRRVMYGIQWATGFEIGYGDFDGGTPGNLTRATVIKSSNANALVTLPSGTKDVFAVFDPGAREVLSISGTTTLALADLGNVVLFTGASASSLNLPAVATVPLGAGWMVINTGTAALTIDPTGAESVNGVSTLTLPPGGTAALTRLSTAWQAARGGVPDDGSVTTAKLAFDGGSLSGTRNRIINGDMRIDQRYLGAATPNTINSYVVDRWYVYQSVAGKVIAQQNAGAITPPPGFTNYLGITSQSAYAVSASDFYILGQSIEGFNVSDLGWGTAAAQPVAISFWVRSSLTGNFGAALSNGLNNRSYPFTFTVNAANTWERKTVSIAGDTSGTWNAGNGIGIGLNFSLGAGTTVSGTAGAWAAGTLSSVTGSVSVVGTNGATFCITGIQLEPGTVATPFERRQIGAELALCQRYYFADLSTHGYIHNAGEYSSYQFKVVMRAVPTVTLTPFNGTIDNLFVSVSGFYSRNVTNTSGASVVASAELTS